MFKYLVLLVAFGLSSCMFMGTKVESVTSPCLSSHRGPCVRVPVNDWWLKENRHIVRV